MADDAVVTTVLIVPAWTVNGGITTAGPHAHRCGPRRAVHGHGGRAWVYLENGAQKQSHL